MHEHVPEGNWGAGGRVTLVGIIWNSKILNRKCNGEEDKKLGAGEGCTLDVMSGRPGAFHKKHGQHVRLLEEETVAHRIDSYNKAVVFTDQPIPQGSMFQVKLLDKGGGWAGSIVSNIAYKCTVYRQCNRDPIAQRKGKGGSLP